MTGVLLVVRSQLRRRVGPIAALALAVALGLGAALGALIAAYRTDRAYPAHVEAAHVADLLVNPSLASRQAETVLRGLPHVRRVTTSDLMLGGLRDPSVRTIGAALADSDPGEVHGSVDGRYTDSDRLIVDEGRRPTGRREVFVTESYRRLLARRLGHGIGVGDRIPIGFLWAGIGSTDQPANPADPLRPLGIEQLRISGFGRLADEVIDDPLFPRQELIVSPDVVRRYTCTPRAVPSSDRDVILRGLIPETCALEYRYFALDVDDPANVAVVKRTAQRRLTDLNRHLPEQWRTVPDAPAYYPVVTTARDNQAAVEHSVRPTVVALELFGMVAGAATLVVALLGAARIMRGGRSTDDVVRALGMRRGGRALALALPSVLGATVGALGAIGVGVLLSPIGPVGDVARVAPHRTFAAPATLTALTIVGGLIALVVAIGITAVVAARPHRDRELRTRGLATRRLVRNVRPDVADGVATAFGRGRAALLPVASAVAIAAVVAATVFGANVSALVADAHRYGWPWQIGVLTGYGYGETDRALVATTLQDRADVRSWDEVGFASGTLEKSPVAVLFAARPIDLALVSGRLPHRPGEAVLGRATAARLGLRVGSRTRLAVRDGPRPVRIVGLAVMPAIGQYQSDRAGLGIGAFTLVPAKQMDDHAVTFLGIHLAPSADPSRTFASIRSRVIRWDATGTPPYSYAAPIRPAEIVNADAMQGAPVILAGVLALALLAALALSLGATVNARRRDYAIYRAIGFTARQVARSVRWHALAAAGAGLVIGIPAGLVGGRWLWGQFAEQLGISPAPTVPVELLVLIGGATVVGALLAAAIPARRAVRLSPAEVLGGA